MLAYEARAFSSKLVILLLLVQLSKCAAQGTNTKQTIMHTKQAIIMQYKYEKYKIIEIVDINYFTDGTLFLKEFFLKIIFLHFTCWME